MQYLDLVAQAADWHLLSVLFESPRPGWAEQISELASKTTDEELKMAAASACAEASETLYWTVFGPGGPAAPREVSYRPSVQPGQFLSQLEFFYEVFAFHPQENEAPDHIAVLCSFMSFLRLKEAYAVANENSADAKMCHAAAARLLEEHISYIAEPLSVLLGASGLKYLEKTGLGLYQRVGPSHVADTVRLEVLEETPSCA